MNSNLAYTHQPSEWVQGREVINFQAWLGNIIFIHDFPNSPYQISNLKENEAVVF